MYYVTIYDLTEAGYFEMVLNQYWLSYEKKRSGFYKVIATEDNLRKIRNKIRWDKILRVA